MQNQKQILEPKNSANKMAPKVISSANNHHKKEEVPRDPPPKEISKEPR